MPSAENQSDDCSANRGFCGESILQLGRIVVRINALGALRGMPPQKGVAAYFSVVGTFRGTYLQQKNSRVGGDVPLMKKNKENM